MHGRHEKSEREIGREREIEIERESVREKRLSLCLPFGHAQESANWKERERERK